MSRAPRGAGDPDEGPRAGEDRALALVAPLAAFLEEAEGALRELRAYQRARVSGEPEEDA